jgi:hypothetical protein
MNLSGNHEEGESRKTTAMKARFHQAGLMPVSPALNNQHFASVLAGMGVAPICAP